jgi:hypothetical protein
MTSKLKTTNNHPKTPLHTSTLAYLNDRADNKSSKTVPQSSVKKEQSPESLKMQQVPRSPKETKKLPIKLEGTADIHVRINNPKVTKKSDGVQSHLVKSQHASTTATKPVNASNEQTHRNRGKRKPTVYIRRSSSLKPMSSRVTPDAKSRGATLTDRAYSRAAPKSQSVASSQKDKPSNDSPTKAVIVESSIEPWQQNESFSEEISSQLINPIKDEYDSVKKECDENFSSPNKNLKFFTAENATSSLQETHAMCHQLNKVQHMQLPWLGIQQIETEVMELTNLVCETKTDQPSVDQSPELTEKQLVDEEKYSLESQNERTSIKSDQNEVTSSIEHEEIIQADSTSESTQIYSEQSRIEQESSQPAAHQSSINPSTPSGTPTKVDAIQADLDFYDYDENDEVFESNADTSSDINTNISDDTISSAKNNFGPNPDENIQKIILNSNDSIRRLSNFESQSDKSAEIITLGEKNDSMIVSDSSLLKGDSVNVLKFKTQSQFESDLSDPIHADTKRALVKLAASKRVYPDKSRLNYDNQIVIRKRIGPKPTISDSTADDPNSDGSSIGSPKLTTVYEQQSCEAKSDSVEAGPSNNPSEKTIKKVEFSAPSSKAECIDKNAVICTFDRKPNNADNHPDTDRNKPLSEYVYIAKQTLFQRLRDGIEREGYLCLSDNDVDDSIECIHLLVKLRADKVKLNGTE